MKSARARLVAASAVLLLFGACHGTAGAVLRVRPPALEPGDEVEAQRRRVEEAVRDVADMGRLECTAPGNDAALLSCWPRDAGHSPAFVSLHLSAAAEGYQVSILESFGGCSGPRNLCAIQERLAERLDVRLGGGRVDRDPRVTCPKTRP